MRKNKIRGKLFVWVALFVFMLGCNAERVLAAETNQNGVIVETTFDKSSYQSEEKIIYSVYIQNTNSEIINIKDINFDIPDGYKLSEETTNESIQNVQPGEHVLLKYYINEKAANSGSGNDDSNTKDDSPSNGDNKGNPSKENNTKIDNSSKENNKGDSVNNNNKVENKSETKQVGTGDNTKILLWIAIMIVALIIIFVIIFHTKNRKGLLSLLLIMATLTEIIISPISVKAEDNPNIITLADKFVVKDIEKNINVHINYEKQSTDLEEDTTTYTRGEWIQEIVNAYGLNVNLEDASETQFTDIENSQYRDYIKIAEIYGIIDTGESFFPDEAATREFAAVTTVRLLGYQGTGMPECKDANDITNKSEVYLALKTGILFLKEGYFEPKKSLNKTDGEIVLTHIKNMLNSTSMGQEENTGYVYKEGVVELDENISFKDNGKQLVFEKDENISRLKQGNIIVIGTQYAFKVEAIKELDNQIVIDYSLPCLEDFIHSMSVCGETNTIDWSKGKLADGLSFVEENEIGLMQANDEDYGDLTTEFKLPPIKLNDDYAVEIKLENFNAKYGLKIDYDSWRINNAYAILGADTTATLEAYKYEAEGDKTTEFMSNFVKDNIPALDWDGKLQIYEVPLIGPVMLELNLVAELDGTVSVEANVALKGGVQIINNAPRMILTAEPDLSVMGDVEASLGTAVDVVVQLFNLEPLISFELTPKAVTDLSATVHKEDPFLCMNMSAYFTIEVSAFDDCVIGDIFKFSWSYELFNEDNSPLRLKEHLEIGFNGLNIPPNCSHDPKEYQLTIYVYDKNTKQPLQQAEVDNGEVIRGVTDQNGLTEIEGEGNTSRITVKKEGYIPKTVEVNPDEYKDVKLEIGLTSIPDGAQEYNGHYYKIFATSVSWDTAKKKCEDMGGYLACVTDEKEQVFINNLNTSNRRVWIGGFRDDIFRWRWVSGEPWSYENWADGEPNNSENVVSNENCVAIWNSRGQWNDLNTNNTYEQSGFICEWE